jgi:antitoxin component YwqK of YwqJK toxin-antitoxin module
MEVFWAHCSTTLKGVAIHADYYDDHKRVRRRLFYREDGTPKSAKEFDERGKVVLEQEFDHAGNLTKQTTPK